MDMKAKERIIFQNYDLDLENAKENLIVNGITEFSDSDVYDEATWISEMEYEDEVIGIKEFLDKYGKYGIICVGICGRWNGNFPGGFIAETWEDVMYRFQDCGFIKIWDENGHLYLKGTHHDGTHSVEIKLLTEKGKAYNETHWHEYDRKVHSQLFKYSRYTNLPRYAERVYGCKKREYESREGGGES